jgi:hypothetical protein
MSEPKVTIPLRNYLVVERTARNEGRIILADSVADEGLYDVQAIAVGPDVKGIEPGDYVHITGIKTALPAQAENHWLIKDIEIAAVLEDDPNA